MEKSCTVVVNNEEEYVEKSLAETAISVDDDHLESPRKTANLLSVSHHCGDKVVPKEVVAVTAGMCTFLPHGCEMVEKPVCGTVVVGHAAASGTVCGTDMVLYCGVSVVYG